MRHVLGLVWRRGCCGAGGGVGGGGCSGSKFTRRAMQMWAPIRCTGGGARSGNVCAHGSVGKKHQTWRRLTPTYGALKSLPRRTLASDTNVGGGDGDAVSASAGGGDDADGAGDYGAAASSGEVGGAATMNLPCAGCGVQLQAQDPGSRGYVNPGVFQRWQQQEEARRAAQVAVAEGASTLQQDDQLVSPEYINDDGSAAALHGFDPQRGDGATRPRSEVARPVCQRCHRLRHYNEDVAPQPVQDMAAQLRDLQHLAPSQKRLGVCVVDITDFPCSLPTDLISRAGLTHVMVAVNKADALALGFHRRNEANRIQNIVARHYREALGRPPVAVHLLSAQTRQGVQSLFKDVFEYCQKHRTEAFLFGATNVGKSSLINAIVQPKEHATVSQQPGTTIGPLCFSLDQQGKHIIGHSATYHTTGDDLEATPMFGFEEVAVFDTPGAPYPGHIAAVLDAEGAEMLQPKARPATRAYSIKAGRAVMVGAVAALEMEHTSGPAAPVVTVLTSAHVRPHTTRAERIQELVQTHAGEPPFQPPLSRQAAEMVPRLVPHRFAFVGEGWRTVCCEVVVAGVGSFSVAYKAEGTGTIVVWAPEGVAVKDRPSLEPTIPIVRGKRLGSGSRAFEPRKARFKSPS